MEDHQPEREPQHQPGQAELPGFQNDHEAVVGDALKYLKLRRPKAEPYPFSRRGIIDVAIGVEEIGGRSKALAGFLPVISRLLLAAGDHSPTSPVPYRRSGRLPAKRSP